MKVKLTNNRRSELVATSLAEENSAHAKPQKSAPARRTAVLVPAHPSLPVQPSAVDLAVEQTKTDSLTPEETALLNGYEKDIETGIEQAHEGFRKMAEAFHQIRERRLYREKGTFAMYFQIRFGFGRSHSNRIADAGRLMSEMSPRGDILAKLNTEAHFRPLTTLRAQPERLEKVLDVLKEWNDLKGGDMSADLVRSAKAVAGQTRGANVLEDRTTTADEFVSLVEKAEMTLPPETSEDIRKVFHNLKSQAASLATPRTSKIEWTQITWNPIQGCSRASTGCENCYAAKFVGTRGADLYPGLSEKKGDSYAFTGKILLLPERLGDPLLNRNPTRIFVNSLSDLFHPKVPEGYITTVFEVMEKANWHEFQVLTKRPDRMAEFTRKRYENSEPFQHIWLGTSTENQEWYDKRIQHLRQVKAAVRWLSCEPLLGPIKLGDTTGIDWVVVGGESKGGRPMDKAWAASLRDQCQTAEIPFFFKQWGDHGEDGIRRRENKEGGAILDGCIHHEYPAACLSPGNA